MTGENTRTEILSQPDVWSAVLAGLQRQADELRAFYREGRYDHLVYTGCGSTYFLALAAAALTQQLTGTPARGVPASEIWLYPEVVYQPGQRALLVALSRSGETTETLRAGEAFKTCAEGDFLTLSCYPDKALSQMGALNLVFPEAQEESIAQTRAYSALYVAVTVLAALWGGREDVFAQMQPLTESARRLLKNYSPLAAELGQDNRLDRFYFLGSGPRYGLACELNLKMKEMALCFSEPFHFLEFRHGPMSMVTPSTLLVGLRSEQNRHHEQAVLEEMRRRGARLLVMAETDTDTDADVVFASGVDESLRNVLYLPIGQLLAFERSLHKSLDPDRPHNLDAVVKL
jgi:glucosamine--fructose-6-phosphate aminotransferase (isomerizing)